MPETAPGDPRRPRRVASAVRLVAVIAASMLLAIVPFLLVGELPGERWLSSQDAHAPGFAALGALLLALDVLLPIPSSVIGTMLGGRLGLPLGFVCSLLGLLAGHSLGYWLGRGAPERWAAQVPSAPSWLAVFASRPLPVLAEALAIAAGAARLPWHQFFVAALLGDAIYAAALAATGAALLPGGGYVSALVAPMLLVVAAAWLVRRLSAREPPARARQ